MKFQQITEGLGQDADIMEQDHEVQMARADCFHAAKNAIELHRMLRNISEQQGLEGWVSEKITLAAEYLSTVKEYLEYEMMGKPDEFDIGPKAEYDQMFGQYMGENQQNKKNLIKEAEQIDAGGKITTPGLNARARELLIKAYGQFPQSENDISALVNYLSFLESRTGRDVTRLDDENRTQDRDINRLDKEIGRDEGQLDMLTQEVRALRDQVSMMTRRGMGESRKKINKPIAEMSAGATGAGSVAAVVAPMTTKKKTKKRPVNEAGPLALLAPLATGGARLGQLALRYPKTTLAVGDTVAGLLTPKEPEEKENSLRLDDAKKERIASILSQYEMPIADLEKQIADRKKTRR